MERVGLSGRYVGMVGVGVTYVGVTVGVAAGVEEGGGVFIGVRVIVGDVAGVGAAEGTIAGDAVRADTGSGVGMGDSMEMGVTAALGIDTGADIRANGAAAYTGIAVAGIGAGSAEGVGSAVGVGGYGGFGISSRYFTPSQTRAITSRLSAADPTADAVTLRRVARQPTRVDATGLTWASSRGHSTTTTPMTVSLPSDTRDST